MEWGIQELARLSGTTSRALRHYQGEGLLVPSRTGANGYRYYDEANLVRLQRILLLRGLGLSIPAIRDVLAGSRDDAEALRSHLGGLQQERERLDRKITSVRATIARLEGGQQLMADKMFDGFDHTDYQAEVESRWGKDAYAEGDSWWRGLSDNDRQSWRAVAKQLGTDWADASERGVQPDSAEAQSLARRQFEWLRSVPGTPQNANGPTREYFIGLGEMYVADERFSTNYGGVLRAEFVRDAMRIFAATNLK